jgi:hypothetical protein
MVLQVLGQVVLSLKLIKVPGGLLIKIGAQGKVMCFNVFREIV